jgi:iron(III) transport system substrate-binding protein
VRRFAFATGLAVFFVGSLSACGTTSGGSGSLVVYSGQHPELTNALVSAFEKQTGINVSVRSGDSIVLAQQLIQQGNSPQADVFLGENSPELTLLQEKGLLAKLDASTLGRVPAVDSSSLGDWVAMAARVSSLVYNKGMIQGSALPPSILDLASSQWKGKVGMAPSDSDFVPWIAAITADKGEAAAKSWLQGLKNNATVYTDFEAVTAAVDRGDVAVGLINQYYWYRLQLEIGSNNVHSAVNYFSDYGTFENLAGAAVMRSAAHSDSAKKFVSFLVSDAGQKILAGGNDFEYPLVAGVPSNPSLPALDAINPTLLSPSVLGDDQSAASLLQSAGLV